MANHTHITSHTALHFWHHGIHSALLAIILLFTLVLNSLLLIVLTKMKSRRSNKDSASYNIEKSYMFLLFHLAFADMLGVVLNIPFDICDNVGVTYHHSMIGCKLLSPTALASTTAQAGTYVALSYHRFRAIVYPIRANLTVCKSILMICIIWSVSFCLSLPFILALRLSDNNCIEQWPQQKLSGNIYTFSIFVVQYVAPVVLMALFYIFIARTLHDSRIAKEIVHVPTQTDIRTHRHIVKMLVIIVTVYSVCMLPHHIFWMINGLHPLTETNHDVIKSIAYLFTYSNSVANPVIFFWYNKESRYHLKRFFLRVCCCAKNMERPFEIRINKWSATWSGNSKSDFSRQNQCKYATKAVHTNLNPFQGKPGESELGVSLPWEAQMFNSHTSYAEDCQENHERETLSLPVQDPFKLSCYPSASLVDSIVPSSVAGAKEQESEEIAELPEIATEGGERVKEDEQEDGSSSEDGMRRVQNLIKKMMDDIAYEMTKDVLRHTDNGVNLFDNFSHLNDSSSTVELETAGEADHGGEETGTEKVRDSSHDIIKDMMSLLENPPQGTEWDMSVLQEQLMNSPETRM